MNKIIIGTVQFSLNYGITNTIGKINDDDIDKIYDFCHQNNILYFDCAQDYGDSEKIMSNYKNKYKNFMVITKAKFVNNDIDLIMNKSFEKFNEIEYFLLHSFSDYNSNNINKLCGFKNKKIKKIGVSIYSVDEANILLDDENIDVIQIPFNYIDNQWDNELFLNKLEFRKNNIEIHVRSIFLQGLLLNFTHKILILFFNF